MQMSTLMSIPTPLRANLMTTIAYQGILAWIDAITGQALPYSRSNRLINTITNWSFDLLYKILSALTLHTMNIWLLAFPIVGKLGIPIQRIRKAAPKSRSGAYSASLAQAICVTKEEAMKGG